MLRRKVAGGRAAKRVLGFLIGLALVWAVTAPADASTNRKQWNEGLQETLAHLRAQEWAPARERAQWVLAAMTEDMAPGDAADRSIGLMLMLRALAEAGLGDETKAAWDWQLAQQFDPRLETHDLAEFGAAGVVLDRHRLRNDPVGEALEVTEGSGISPPEKIEAKQPVWPMAMRRLGIQGTIAIRLVVEEDGSLSHPRIERRVPAATMVLATAEAMSGWRFHPARLEGRPVRVQYTLMTKFSLRP
jgi:TonB family protein